MMPSVASGEAGFDGAKDYYGRMGGEDAFARKDFAICRQAIWRGTARLSSSLVDLIGIEPMTSSMLSWPNYRRHSTYKPAESAKTGKIGGICDKNATYFPTAGHGLIVWNQPKFSFPKSPPISDLNSEV